MTKASLRALLLPAVLLLVWQVCGWLDLTNPVLFPSPTAILAMAWEMIRTGELFRELAATLRRFSIGLTIGALAGFACGLLMGAWRPARDCVEPMIAALYSTPKLTLLPMLMLFFGIGDQSKIFLIALVGFIFLAVETLDAIRGVDRHYLDMARNYGATNWQLIRKVYVPGSLPHVFTGIRLAASRSLVMAISLELIASSDGLGSIIWMSWQTLRVERLFVGILMAAILGAAIYRLLSYLEKNLVPWRTE